MMTRTLVFTAALATLPMGVGTRVPVGDAPVAETQDPAGDADRGRQVYLRNNCQTCHGTVGQGGAAPVLAASTLPYDAFAMQIREPAAGMPAYDEKLVSDPELADIHAYLKSLPGPMTTLPRILRD
jgi:mono/diheme cytochrome c family protein